MIQQINKIYKFNKIISDFRIKKSEMILFPTFAYF